MKLKALLLCEDVRVEARGTLTLVGVFNDRVFVDAVRERPDGGLELPRLAVVVVVAGLAGVEQVAFRVRTRQLEAPDPEPPNLVFEAHDPEADEHNFVLVQSPMVFPGVGGYELMFEVDAGGELEMFRYKFGVAR